MRNISFFLTQNQILARTKTVTRRIGWGFAVPGMVAQPIVKGQGLKRGEGVTKLGGPIRIVSVRDEILVRLLKDPDYGAREAELEGVPGWTGERFVEFICKQPGIYPQRVLNRIEFEYVD